MSRKFISPKDPLRHERQRVRDLEGRLERAETTSLASPRRDGDDEVGAALNSREGDDKGSDMEAAN